MAAPSHRGLRLVFPHVSHVFLDETLGLFPALPKTGHGEKTKKKSTSTGCRRISALSARRRLGGALFARVPAPSSPTGAVPAPGAPPSGARVISVGSPSRWRTVRCGPRSASPAVTSLCFRARKVPGRRTRVRCVALSRVPARCGVVRSRCVLQKNALTPRSPCRAPVRMLQRWATSTRPPSGRGTGASAPRSIH